MVTNCSRGETVRYLTILQGNPTYDVLIQANCRYVQLSTVTILGGNPTYDVLIKANCLKIKPSM